MGRPVLRHTEYNQSINQWSLSSRYSTDHNKDGLDISECCVK